MSLTELPFGLPGRLFRSPMPFGPYDLHSLPDTFLSYYAMVV